MTDTLVTSAPSVILASLRVHYLGNVLDDGIWGRGSRTPNENTFNSWIANRDGWAMAQLAEAHALDVLHDAYAIADIEHTHPHVFKAATTNYSGYLNNLTFTPADPFAHIDAMIHEEFPGALPDAKLGKLRALAQERLDLKSEIESYKRALQEPITDGHDPRIRDLMVKAAEVANEHDYCEVYDIIAGEVGLWNRKELGLIEQTYFFQITGTGTEQEMREALSYAHPTFNISSY